jgi:uncharacterized protein
VPMHRPMRPRPGPTTPDPAPDPVRGPVRTCVACRRRASPDDLERLSLVATAAGDRLHLGPGPGRGAWVCQVGDCLDVAASRGSLARALRRPSLPDGLDEVRERLRPGPGDRSRATGT